MGTSINLSAAIHQYIHQFGISNFTLFAKLRCIQKVRKKEHDGIGERKAERKEGLEQGRARTGKGEGRDKLGQRRIEGR